MKFTKQRTLSECGPRAIFNALAWAGSRKVPFNRLKLQCQTDKYGTSTAILTTVINRYFDYKRSRLSRVRNLKTDEAMLVGYSRNEGKDLSGHYVFVYKEGNKFVVVNYISHRHFNVVDKTTMNDLFVTKKYLSEKQVLAYLKPFSFQGKKYHSEFFLIGREDDLKVR